MGRAMAADRKSLGLLGCILGGVTLAVMLVAATTVLAHVDGRLALENAPVLASASR